jgi:hypothetical protein
VHHQDFADQQAAKDFVALLVANGMAGNGFTYLVSLQNLTPQPPTLQLMLPGAKDFPWRAHKAPRT